ncbi:hypothetical protein DE146DRAFT_780321 [Phaeosphaeria sp. MPI-PUGE-AT-0046c]|nr:hypothetical protein DE146DRAFT_780321 [Phaeosphaeria sp. MPI-PUGE-AT-0046c]
MAQVPPQMLSSPHILRLPREIRDQIYDTVFQAQEPFEVTVSNYLYPRGRGNTMFLVSYTLPNTAETEHPAQRRHNGLKWLLANKQICEEGIEQFQRKATWTLTDIAAAGQEVDVMDPSSPAYRGRAKEYRSCLILPSAARNLVVQMPLAVSSHLEMDNRENAFLRMYIQAGDIIPRLFSQRTGSTNLQVLSMTLRPWYLETYATDVPIKFHQLPPLDAPSLSKIIFMVEHPDGSCGAGETHTFSPAFEKALSEVGMELIGGEGVMTHTITTARRRTSMYTYIRE